MRWGYCNWQTSSDCATLRSLNATADKVQAKELPKVKLVAMADVKMTDCCRVFLDSGMLDLFSTVSNILYQSVLVYRGRGT